MACASSSDPGEGLRSTLAKPKSLRLRVGNTWMCRWGTSSPAMIIPARWVENARHTALPISWLTDMTRPNNAGSTFCQWSISARGTTKVWPCVIGSIVKNATTSSSS
ncbi:Uncharacterised protein [Mycobacterium tuberculosis]|nr:Uncharacterised protein [Mycobacterium tuberculosis]